MKKHLTIALAVLGVTAVAVGAAAEEAARWIGALPSHHSVEKYEMSVGITPGARSARSPVKFEEVRQVVHVPEHYGSLVFATGDGQAAVLWYRDTAGALRNVVFKEPETHPYEVFSQPTARYEADLREK